MKKNKKETNPMVVNREMRTELGCSFCPPNRGENETRKPKHGVKKPKKKNKR